MKSITSNVSIWQCNVNLYDIKFKPRTIRITRKDDDGIYQGKARAFPISLKSCELRMTIQLSNRQRIMNHDQRFIGIIIPTSFHDPTDLLNSAGSGGT